MVGAGPSCSSNARINEPDRMRTVTKLVEDSGANRALNAICTGTLTWTEITYKPQSHVLLVK